MLAKFALAAAAAAAVSLTHAPAFAAGKDYAFEPVAAEVKKGDDVVVAVRLVHKPTGKAVAEALIIRTRVDMAPDGMAEMESPVAPLPSKEPDVYVKRWVLNSCLRMSKPTLILCRP